MRSRRNAVFKAASVVAGNGIGSGVMAIPYYVVHTGVLGGVLAFAAAYIVSVLMHLMIAEMILHTKDTSDILAIFNNYLFRGRSGKIIRLVFFILLVVVLIANLSAYISGASEIVTGIFPVSCVSAKIIFFVFAAVVVFAGLGAVCTGEAVSVSLMAIILLLMSIFSALHTGNGTDIKMCGNIKEWAAAYGMIMFSFSAIFAVPQVVKYLSAPTAEGNTDLQVFSDGETKKDIKRAIWLGLLINLVLSVTVAVCTVITSGEVTEIAIVGWAQAVGGAVMIAGSVFIIFAMLTSFWSIGLAVADIVAGGIRVRREISFALATVPALILTLLSGSSFTDYLKLVGGAVAIIIALMAVPSFLICMKEGESEGIMYQKGNRIIAVFVFIMYVVMAVGSCVKI